MRPDRIPLFPLNVVLFPGGDLPLHIFEPRYRAMVKDCLKQKSEFGMLLAVDNGVARVGCTAEILKVAKRYEDGRMDIFTVGRAPFRVIDFYAENPLLEGIVDYLDDGEALPELRTQQELTELFEVCHTLIFDDYPRIAADKRCKQPQHPSALSYRVASTLPIDLLWKQQVLELRSERDRQERLVAYLREWAPHLQKVKAFCKNSDGNGFGLN